MAAGGRPTFLTHLTQGTTVKRYLDYLEESLQDPLEASAYIEAVLEECCRDEVREAFQKVSKIFGHGISFDVFFAFDPNLLGGSSNNIIWVGAGDRKCIIVDNEFPDERFITGYGLNIQTRKYTITSNTKLPFSEKIIQFIEEELNKKTNQIY